QMFIEATDQLRWVEDLHAVLAEGFSNPAAEDALAAAFFPARHEGDLARLTRLLVQPSEPVQNIIGVLNNPAADHLLDMLAHQAPIARFWFDVEAAPQVHVSRRRPLGGVEGN